MQRVLIALEQGSNLGHASIASSVAQVLIDQGHEPAVAASAHELKAAVFRDVPYRLIEAPACHVPKPARPVFSWISMATVLWDLGLGRADAAPALYDAWRTLYEQFKPDAIIFNTAPFAQLAAIGLGVPRIRLGLPFDLVPSVSPLPPMQPWARLPLQQARGFEAQLQANITRAMGVPNSFACLGELLHTDATLITSLPELDQYGKQAGRCYVGPVSPPRGGLPLAWRNPHHKGRRALAYLRSHSCDVMAITQALEQQYDDVVVACPDAPDSALQRFDGNPRVRLQREFIDIASLLPQSHLVVSHAGSLMVQATVLGLPQVVLPTQVEQLVSARLLVEQGLGVMALPGDVAACVEAVHQASRMDASTGALMQARLRHAPLAAQPEAMLASALQKAMKPAYAAK